MVTPLQVENVTFPATVKPPSSDNAFFLGGAGERGIQIQDQFVKFTAIGIYLQEIATPFLAVKWNGKSVHQLTEADDFFRDIVTGPFEKFMRVTMILPLTGQQYSEKVSENCVAIWKSLGIYTDEEAKAIDKFVSVFKDETFPPGSSILFTVSPKGSLRISFSKDGSIPEVESTVIENKLLSEAVLESMIGKHGVSPAAKQSLACRLSQLFKECGCSSASDGGKGLSIPIPTHIIKSEQVENFTFPATVKPPSSDNAFFLGGAGERGIQIQDKFVKFTAIGIYLQEISIPFLAVKWNGKSSHQLTESDDFFRDIVTGPFEKFMQVTMILPLTGHQYSEKVSENCVAIWKSLGIYTDEEAKAIDKFVSVFKDEIFPPGSSILFTVSPKGSLRISFSKDGSIPEVESTVIENKLLSEAVLESMIGKHGVSPAAKQSLACRLSQLFLSV